MFFISNDDINHSNPEKTEQKIIQSKPLTSMLVVRIFNLVFQVCMHFEILKDIKVKR